MYAAKFAFCMLMKIVCRVLQNVGLQCRQAAFIDGNGEGGLKMVLYGRAARRRAAFRFLLLLLAVITVCLACTPIFTSRVDQNHLPL